jgi:hypothetical protein
MKTNEVGNIACCYARHEGWILYFLFVVLSRDSSVGIAAGYGLDDQGGREFETR